MGEVKLVDKPYQDRQQDENGHNRKVWIFPIKPIHAGKIVTPEKYTIPASKPALQNYEKEKKVLEANATPEFAEILADDVLKKAAELRGKSKRLKNK